jgi:hypothetical protein
LQKRAVGTFEEERSDILAGFSNSEGVNLRNFEEKEGFSTDFKRNGQKLLLLISIFEKLVFFSERIM